MEIRATLQSTKRGYRRTRGIGKVYIDCYMPIVMTFTYAEWYQLRCQHVRSLGHPGQLNANEKDT